MSRTQFRGDLQLKTLTVDNNRLMDNTIELIKLADSLKTRLILKNASTGVIEENINMGNHSITGLTDAIELTGAVTLQQLQASASNLKYLKAPVLAVSVLEVTDLSAVPQATLDGAELLEDDRVLINRFDSDKTLNGLYVVSAVNGNVGEHTYTLVRASDGDASADFTYGMVVNVVGGDTMDGSEFILVGYDTNGNKTIELGTDEMIFERRTGLGMVTVGYGLTKTPTQINDNLELLLAVNGGLIADADGLRVTTTTLIPSIYANQEVPTGAINGVNTVFTISQPIMENSEIIFYNIGILYRGDDYTIDYLNKTITLNFAPAEDDKLRITYFIAQ